MSELEQHLEIAGENLNRLLATIDDPDQSKLVSMLFHNIVNAISTVRMQCDALAEKLEAVQKENGGKKPGAGGNGEAHQSPQMLAAVDAGHLKRVMAMLADGADINARDDNGCTLLSRSVLRGHKDLAEFLLSSGADVNAQAHAGWTALDIAERRHSEEFVDLLLAHGAQSGKIPRG